MAAQLLVRSNLLGQAESEYATALRYSPDPRPVLKDLIATLPPERVARAMPTELRIDATVRTLDDMQRLDLAMLWLERVIVYTTDLRAADALYSLAMNAKAYDRAERASRKRCQVIPSKRCQLELARVLGLAGKHADVAKTLEDAMTWRGRADDQLAGWLMLCEAQIALGKLSDATDCLRRLDISGLVKPGDPDLQRRRDAVKALMAPTPPPPLIPTIDR